MQMIENFHFLRPWWLLALIPTVLVLFTMFRKQNRIHAYSQIIAPHLLKYLIVGEDQKNRFRPIIFLSVFWGLALLALAGPSFTMEPSPFSEDSASIMIALQVNQSMLEKDIQPSRLARSVQKITDFLSVRPGARTGLVAFAGSAHLAMPLTTDHNVIGVFAGELTPEIMPEKGRNIEDALNLSDHWLKESDSSGAILLIVDTISPDQLQALAVFRNQSLTPVHIFCVAAAPDVTAMKNAADKLKASLTFVAADDSDIRRLTAQIKQRFSLIQKTSEDSRRKDAGYYLVPIIVLLSLLWFRRGWIVTWES